MKAPSDRDADAHRLRERLIGLGEKSLRKSYYPQLQERLADLERFRALLDQTHDAIFLIRLPQGSLVDLNETARQWLGRPREDILSLPLDRVLGPEAGAQVRRLVSPEKNLTEDGDSVAAVLLSSPTRTMPVEITMRRVSFGGETYCVAVARDITERKRAEEDLDHERERFRVLVEESPLGVALIRPDGVYEYVNPCFKDMFGYTIETIPDGRTWFRQAFPDQELRRQAIKEWLGDLSILGPGKGRPRSYPVVCADGDRKEVQFRAVALESGYNLVLYEDITQQHYAEEERSKLEAQLRQAQKMEALGTLAGGIAHDFNNILQVIGGYVQLLFAPRDLEARTRTYLAEVDAAVQRATDLVQRLLTFSRKVEPELRPLDLNQEVREGVKMLERIIPKMISIQTNLARDIPFIRADAGQLNQVVMNLGANARDAMPDGGRLVIQTENVTLAEKDGRELLGLKPGPYVLLHVSDTGQGMDEDTLKHIFDPFYTTKELGKGTGLGLAMVYGIVKGHGGHVNCYSRVGQGTTFKIYLPALDQAEAPAPAADLEKAEEVGGGRETILLVDDEAAVINTATEILESRGYTVLAADSGEKALEVYRAQDRDIDLVVLDLGMPGIGGRRCLEELIKLNPAVKVIIASGYALTGVARETVEKGAKGFIGKPYRLVNLLRQVREVLDGN
ncbi:MAG: response regulator [Thermodesulfobacteriota bacterium]